MASEATGKRTIKCFYIGTVTEDLKLKPDKDYIYMSTDLRTKFTTSPAVLDEMRNIRYIEHEGHAPRITPFVGKQVNIANAFGFKIPQGCEPGYKSVKVGKKRGRPRKIKQD